MPLRFIGLLEKARKGRTEQFIARPTEKLAYGVGQVGNPSLGIC